MPLDPTAVPRVALSMLTFVPGGMGGSETYARELASRLATSSRVDAVAVVAEGAIGAMGPIAERPVSGITARATTAGRIETIVRGTLGARRIRELLADRDIVHYPFTVPVPSAPRGAAVVQTLFDVQHLDLPELFSRAELAFRRRFYEGAAARADVVITISEFARERILHHLPRLDPDRVIVAPMGVDTGHYSPHRGEREPFVLYPARGWPHKNHARLVEAMALVRRTRPELRLVLTGGALDGLGALPEWVDRKGLVSADELARLYRTAGVVAFPSLYEGFGIPPLEAMASGAPVAVAAAGSLPEVVGDAAVLFDPRDPESIAAGILTALDRGADFYEAGLERAASFTWDRCVDVHLDVYERVAAGR